jgi:FkbM family methyltransferase
MSRVKGFAYWLATSSPLAGALGSAIRHRPFDGLGRLSLPHDISPKAVTGIACGAYEYSERYLIRKWLPRNLDVVELGASIGIISREILIRIEPQMRLVAVEALQKLVDLAKSNIGIKFSSRNWQVEQGAIAYGCDKVAFASGAEHIAGRISGEGTQEIKATSLARILDDFGIGEYSLVMDIEGAEHEVLRNDLESLERCRCVIVELHGEQAAKDTFCRSLQSVGMHIVERKHSVAAFLRK